MKISTIHMSLWKVLQYWSVPDLIYLRDPSWYDTSPNPQRPKADGSYLLRDILQHNHMTPSGWEPKGAGFKPPNSHDPTWRCPLPGTVHTIAIPKEVGNPIVVVQNATQPCFTISQCMYLITSECGCVKRWKIKLLWGRRSGAN